MKVPLPRSLTGLVALACVGLLPALAPTARADGDSLLVVDQWPVPGALSQPAVAFDGPAHVGYVLSGLSDASSWDRVQAVDATTGRALAPRVAIPPMRTSAPFVVDQRRHVVIYAEKPANPLPGSGVNPEVTAPAYLVGIGLRAGAVRVLFRVASRFPGERLAGMTLDDAGRDLLVLAARNPSDVTEASAQGTSIVGVDRVSLDGLMRNTLDPRWSSPFQLPLGLCPELLSTAQPAALLQTGTELVLACRSFSSVAGNGGEAVVGRQAGVLRLAGVTSQRSPTIGTTFYPTAGGFEQYGESYADQGTQRVVLVDQGNAGQGLHVFDTAHGRYVGTVKAGAGAPAGIVSDGATGRLYVASGVSSPSLGEFDLAPVVPAQGEVDNAPFGAMIAADNYARRRLAFDQVSRRLFLPYLASGGQRFLAVIRDDLPPYVQPPSLDYDAGALDAVDQPGVTDSTRAASASTFGASYALVGGLGSLMRNIQGGQSGDDFKGTRSLRQAVVRSTSLSGDAATAEAVLADEDSDTDTDRSSVGQAASPAPIDAGSSFAPAATCADFGSSAGPATVLTAQVSCDLRHERAAASASYETTSALLMTLPGTPRAEPAPVQVGRSSSEVVETRGPDRGALVTTVRARAENVDLLGVATIASVSSSVTVTAHGRRGTALASPPQVQVSGLVVQGVPVCGASCTRDQVVTALNTALGTRGHVEFPQAQVIRTRGGTYAAVTQDPWYHAERVSELSLGDDDFAVPAMTITVYLDGTVTSRLVVELAAVDAGAVYRVFALAQDDPDVSVGPVPAVTLPVTPVTSPAVTPTSFPRVVADGGSVGPSGGLTRAVIRAVTFGLRSPAQAWPLLLVWGLLGCAPYLAARRRLLLEPSLPTLELERA